VKNRKLFSGNTYWKLRAAKTELSREDLSTFEYLGMK